MFLYLCLKYYTLFLNSKEFSTYKNRNKPFNNSIMKFRDVNIILLRDISLYL